MGLHAVYAVEGRDEPVMGDRLATGKGWLKLCEWVDTLDDVPCLADLVEEGELYPAEALDELQAELMRLFPTAEGDVRHVAERLLEVVRARPDGTVGLLVSDGVVPDPDRADDEEEP